MLTVFIILSTQSSCRKVIDYIRDHPDGHDTPCRITQIRVAVSPERPDTFNITYNAQGNPLTMLSTKPYYSGSNFEQYFRYDRFGRLSDYYTAFIKAEGVMLWHKYAYPHDNLVTDTLIPYTGSIHGPAPIASDNPFGYYITGYTFDAQGRMAKVWNMPYTSQGSPQLDHEITYDANGNQPHSDPGFSYDNKVNVYRTSKVWQFVYFDYSRNNLVRDDGTFTPTYNSFGLPLNLRALRIYTIRPYFDLFDTGTEITLSYACTAPQK